MRESSEEKSSGSRRHFQEDEPLSQSSSRTLQQNLSTLREGYSWMSHFENEHPGYRFLRSGDIPWTPFEGSLSDSKVALVTTTGVYVKDQKPFSVSPGEVTVELMRYKFREKGDSSFRVIPSSVDLEELQVAHCYLDLSAAREDINTLFPFSRLRELEEEYFIGSLASQHISFMGYLPHLQDIDPFLKDAIGHLKQDEVNVVVLTPGEVLSHQTMAVLQRAIEREGIATVSISLCRDLIQQVGVPRCVHYRFPFGFTLGDVNDQSTQLSILKDTLRVLEEAEEPGTIIELGYQWSEG